MKHDDMEDDGLYSEFTERSQPHFWLKLIVETAVAVCVLALVFVGYLIVTGQSVW